MNAMVGQVLLFARIDARRLPVEPCAVNVAAFARELVRTTETANGKRNPIHRTGGTRSHARSFILKTTRR